MRDKTHDNCMSIKVALRLVLGIILVVILGLAIPTQAAAPYSLTIDYHYGDARTAIGGGAFDVVCVATRDSSRNSYTLIDPFTASGVDPNAVGSDVKAVATQLQAIYAQAAGGDASGGNTADGGTRTANTAMTVTTGDAGRGSLEIATAGLYLIWQSSGTGTAAGYYDAAPMLVYIPTVNDDGATWQNAITIEPKTTPRPSDNNNGGNDGDGDDGDNGDDGDKETPLPVAPIPVPEEEIPDEIADGGDPDEDATGDDSSTPDDGEDDPTHISDDGDLTHGQYNANADANGGHITGDESPMRIYLSIALFALIVCVALVLRRQMRKR